MAIAESTERMTRVEYERLATAGRFEGQRLELLHGRVVTMSPIGTRHCEAVHRVTKALDALGDGTQVRVQSSLVADDESEPEPDVALVDDVDYSLEHPARTYLVVEVAESSLAHDLGVKAELYAASPVDEYWVLDLEHDVIHVHRRAGATWAPPTIVRDGTLAPGRFPHATIDVRALMPRRASR